MAAQKKLGNAICRSHRKYYHGEGYQKGKTLLTRAVELDPTDAEADWAEIVGVVGNTRFESLGSEPRSEIFRPFSQSPMPFLSIVIKSRSGSDTVFSSLRQVVADIDPDRLGVEPARTLESGVRLGTRGAASGFRGVGRIVAGHL